MGGPANDADPVDRREKAIRPEAEARGVDGRRIVVDPEDAEKLHAREPAELNTDWPQRADQSGGSRPKPNVLHETMSRSRTAL